VGVGAYTTLLVFAAEGEEGIKLLARWLAWAQRWRIAEFLKLARRIRSHKEGIEARLRHRMSNGRVETTNSPIQLLTRSAHGFQSPISLMVPPARAYLLQGVARGQ